MCSQCQRENPQGAKFCNACGAKLEEACPQCGYANPPGSQFCNECGSPLTTQPQPVASAQLSVASSQPLTPSTQHLTPSTQRADARPVDGERKTITALFADIKGSMNLIEGLDPEEARHLIDPALQLMIEAVHHYDGYVAQSTGDGIFALFGAPIAHEDHPQRALYAALRMQEESRRYAERLRREGKPPIEIRVGVNTGEVVVRSIQKDERHADYVPIGHSTSLAARLESLATGGAIVVSEQTYKLTEGYFQFAELGPAQIKGVSAPVSLYQVLSVGPLRTRLQIAAGRGLVRFVGRQRELEAIEHALELAKTGQGQIVGVRGEPGVGKSRLFYEFKQRFQRGCLVLETFSVSHDKASPYLPLLELLKTYFQIQPHDDERARREKVIGKVLGLDRTLEDTLPYLFTLLNIEDPASSLQQMDPQIRRRRTFEALKRLLVRESQNQPVILICEDLHWLDSESQAFLVFLSESMGTAPLLLLVNYRPEYQHSWQSKSDYTQLLLAPLGPAEVEELLRTLVGDEPEMQPIKQLIVEKTAGNPFFTEELLHALIEQGVITRDTGGIHLGATKFSELRLPPTVQGILASRIDRLPGDEKTLLQTVAVIGKEFSFSLLKQVVRTPESNLQRQLAHLHAAEFLYEQPAFPEVEYIFKHALTQEVAYNSLLVERRKSLHEQVAQAIEEVYHSQLEEYYSELAHHYTRSGNTQKAVDYLQLAGQQAVQRSAYAEAINHLTPALDLLKTLTETPERIQQELILQIALGTVLTATKGWAAPEVESVYTRARQLCQQVGETPQLFPVLWGLWAFYLVRAAPKTAYELAEQLFTLAQRVRDPALLIVAHDALGGALFTLGEFVRARDHLEQSLALYDPQRHHSLAFLMGGEELGVVCRDRLAVTLWWLGYPAQALQRIREALTLAQELRSPFNLVFALGFAAILHQFRREGQLTRERAEALLTLSHDQGFLLWLGWGSALQGWALAEQGRAEEGIVHLRQGLGALRATGTEGTRPHFLALLVEACEKVGQTEEGLTVLAEALDLVSKTGERFWEAELYRLKGKLVLQSGVRGPASENSNTQHPTPSTPAEAEAEACFLKAIDIARHQSAKSLELRAIMSLARLWQQQGKRAAARQTLADIYNWFTEGFDTVDLQEAKKLLDQLA